MSKGHGAKSEHEREAAIAALLTQRNTEEAAKAAGIGLNTLLRWLKDQEFNRQYREARRAAFLQATARLQQAASAAATTLLKVMVDPGSPPAVRVRAANNILEHAARGIEVEDIEVRLAELERVAPNNNR